MEGHRNNLASESGVQERIEERSRRTKEQEAGGKKKEEMRMMEKKEQRRQALVAEKNEAHMSQYDVVQGRDRYTCVTQSVWFWMNLMRQTPPRTNEEWRRMLNEAAWLHKKQRRKAKRKGEFTTFTQMIRECGIEGIEVEEWINVRWDDKEDGVQVTSGKGSKRENRQRLGQRRRRRRLLEGL